MKLWLINVLRVLVAIFYPPCTPKGRQTRIEQLMEDTGEIREVCASIVYSRDATRVAFTFTDEERAEAIKLLGMLEHNRIRMPVDRK